MSASITSRGAPALKVPVATAPARRISATPRRGVAVRRRPSPRMPIACRHRLPMPRALTSLQLRRPQRAAAAAAAAAVTAPARPAAPLREASAPSAPPADALISTETIRALEAELDAGAAIAALRRFDAALLSLDSSNWHQRLRPVLAELAFNLESFNPAFTAVLLRVQQTIGYSDYARRDAALARLVQPLAGEYGLHAGEPLGRTHRELFALFAEDLLREPLSDLMATSAAPVHGRRLFAEMMRDIMGEGATEGGQAAKTPLEAASYALGYNLAIEYLADYEKVGAAVWGRLGCRVWNITWRVAGSSARSSIYFTYYLLMYHQR
jgi:hypothetical protein